MRKLLSGLPLLTLLLVGCAMSPQEIDVSPKIAIGDSQQRYSGVVSVTVYDDRVSHVLGSRGGVYEETNRITTAPNFTLAVRSSVELALRERGLQVTESEDVPQFQVYIDKLEYLVPDASYVTQINLKALGRVVILNDDRRFEGRYSSEISKKVVSAPSDKDNVALVNDLVSDVLERAFGDPALKQFLGTLGN